MPRKRQSTSAKPKKIKLTPEQLEQTAAIAEIEAILNFKHSPEEPALKKRARVSSKQSAKRGSSVNKAVEKIKEATNSQPKIGNLANGVASKKINFLSVRQEAARSPYTVNLKKVLEEREQTDRGAPIKDWKKLPQFIKAFPAHKQEAIAAIKNYPRPPVTPVGILWQMFAATKGTGRASLAYASEFYRRHHLFFDELLIFNLLTLAAVVFWRAFKIIGKVLTWAGRAIGRSKGVNNIITLSKSFFAAASQTLSFLVKKIGRAPKAIAAVFHAARQSWSVAAAGAKRKTTVIAERQAKIIDRAADFWERLKLNWRTLKFLPPLAWQRQLIGFTLMAVILVLPLKLLGYFNVLQ
ncbi:MAG: hypothetical protein AAB956_02415, partial [Patescibacteria group bacterium]